MTTTNAGWIKIHRKIIKWEWYQDLPTKSLFFHLLLTANIEDKKWQGKVIKRGQLITSRAHLAAGSGLTEKQVRTALQKLEATGEITREATNRYTLITVEKYSDYQLNPFEEGQQRANKRPAEGQQRATTKEVKEYKEVKEDKRSSSFKARRLTCPACGDDLVERALNGSLCWCHKDGWKKEAKCSVIFNSVEEIQKYKSSQEQIPELTERQRKNLERLEKLMAGIGG